MEEVKNCTLSFMMMGEYQLTAPDPVSSIYGNGSANPDPNFFIIDVTLCHVFGE
jgi:hypothetical protein